MSKPLEPTLNCMLNNRSVAECPVDVPCSFGSFSTKFEVVEKTQTKVLLVHAALGVVKLIVSNILCLAQLIHPGCSSEIQHGDKYDGEELSAVSLNYLSNNRLAGRLTCGKYETRSFRYDSESSLWGEVHGKISLSADIDVSCLGYDVKERFGSEVLKYAVTVNRVELSPKSNIRRKRGIWSWFRNAWNTVKNFVTGLFGGNSNSDGRSDDTSTESEETPISSPDFSGFYSTPFFLVQFANGSIPEVRFSQNDTNEQSRNFKRHIAEIFATQMDKLSPSVMVKSPLGEHRTRYVIRSGDKEGHRVRRSVPGPTPDIIVEKHVESGDIVRLSSETPHEPTLNRKENVELYVKQIQMFSEGKLIAAEGDISVALLNRNGKRRRRSEENVDITSYFQVKSTFSLNMIQQRRKREIYDDLDTLENKLKVIPSSLIASQNLASGLKERLNLLRSQYGNPNEVLSKFLENAEKNDPETMFRLLEILDLEKELKLRDSTGSFTSLLNTALISKNVLTTCDKSDSSQCRDILKFLSHMETPEAQKSLLHYLINWSHVPKGMAVHSATVLSELSNPTSVTVNVALNIVSSISDPEIKGILLLSLGTLANRGLIGETKLQELIIDLTKIIKSNSAKNCQTESIVFDTLETFGNIGTVAVIKDLLDLAGRCNTSEIYQTSVLHALRKVVHVLRVRQWLLDELKSGSCSLAEAVLETLAEETLRLGNSIDSNRWPRIGFNEVDEFIRSIVENQQPLLSCVKEQIYRYFKNKQDEKAKETVSLILQTVGNVRYPPAEGFRRVKRQLWDDTNCETWTEGDHYNSIQSHGRFKEDVSKFDRKKHCLAYKYLGVKQANAEVYAGVFAGVRSTSSPMKFKMMAKLVSDVEFLGNNYDVGTLYFNHANDGTRVYVNVLGDTKLEVNHANCSQYSLTYRPSDHFPVYSFSVFVVDVSLGVRVEGQIGMNMKCENKDGNKYQVRPVAGMRLAGEARGRALFAEGALNLGGNFNYHIDFDADLTPDACISSSYGYDPMNISLEANYRVLNPVTDNSLWEGTWRPQFLSWTLKDGSNRPWLSRDCLALDIVN
ncbi:uncharacterized protein LOC143238370 [Tachypleus tridentatus]|uniref:uncharacterized protein LOC143238370 n=1 Tax=Tachypleus tridentatus TaxID=6853 RepID=UPI003FCF09CB